ncbi:MAG: metallophosphoesterase [Candidatus Gastranaerophilales bacterium]|nr:metallophosphoesterase [Candidatus Gastranaerophilales bacterium]
MDVKSISSVNFASSVLNIASVADNHGDILGVPQVIKTIQGNSKDIFDKKDKESTRNILAIAGDFFMNPAKKGVLTDKHSSFGDIQYNLFDTLIDKTKELFEKKNFNAIYTPGNHCYGGGDEWLYNRLLMQRIPCLNVLMSNINLQKSPTIAKIMQQNYLIKTEKIIEIPDSKNPKLKNHVLLLGITIPSMYYHPKGFKYTEFYDQTPKTEYQIGKKDLRATLKFLKERIQNFKEEHPRGAVVLLSHTGNKISNIFAENVEGINVILNGHDHKDFNTLVNGTQILSHGQNNNFVVGTSIYFDDNGKLKKTKNRQYSTTPYIRAARNDKALHKSIKRFF